MDGDKRKMLQEIGFKSINRFINVLLVMKINNGFGYIRRSTVNLSTSHSFHSYKTGCATGHPVRCPTRVIKWHAEH